MPSSIRPNVLKMTPYSPGKPIADVRRELGLERIVKLASNENPLGPSPKAVVAVQQAALKMNLYPDGASLDFRSAIASHYNMPLTNVIVGNGSDDIIQLLGLVFLGSPEDEVVVGDPSFVCYDAAAHLAGCRLIKVPLDSEQRHDLDAMIAHVSPRTKLVFIANPNNPTGTVIATEALNAFLAKLPASVTVVLDEAYFEFAAGLADVPDSANYVRAGANVVGMRTLSKAYGLAGLRIGYAFVPAFVRDAYDRARQPFHVNCLAQAGGIAALDDKEHLRKTLEMNEIGGARIAAALQRFGARTWPSYANFIWADLGKPARPVFENLLAAGVITRDGAVFGCPNCLRVSVGSSDEIDVFENALAGC